MRKYLYTIIVQFLTVCTVFAQADRLRMATAIDMGTYSDFFTFTDTKNTGDYTNGYTHIRYNYSTDTYYSDPPAQDIFYKLTITGKSMELRLKNWGSSFSNGTMFYILDADGTELSYNELSDSQSPYNLYTYSVQPGTYYIVAEARTYDNTSPTIGNIKIEVAAFARRTGEDFFYPTVLGTYGANFNATHTIGSDVLSNYKCDFKDGSATDKDTDRKDVVHQFTITKPMDISLDIIGSYKIESMSTVSLTMLTSSMDTIFPRSVENLNLSTLKLNYELAPGTYNIYSKFTTPNYSDAKYTLNVTGKEQLAGSALSNPIEIGSKSVSFTFGHTQNTGLFNISRNPTKSGNEAVYRLTLTVPMEITVDNCGSAVNDTYLMILSEDRKQLYSNDAYSGTGACSNTEHAYIKVAALLPGTYYIMSDGVQNGNITTTVKGTSLGPMGDRMITAIDAGSHEVGFAYSDVKNTSTGFTNQYTGKTTNDVFYKFTLKQPMDITVSHCGSAVTDTYMTILNSSGTAVYSNDNYTGTGQCTSTGNALIKISQLATGTYYIVSEGNTANGSITTTIDGRSAYANINTTKEQPHIISLTPTVESTAIEMLSAGQLQRSVQYYNYFGTPSVNIQLDNSPLGGDLVTLTENDGFLRAANTWLPIAKNTAGGQYVSPDQIKLDAKSAAMYGGEQKPYSQTIYDGSPLNLIVEQYGPGNDWYINSRSVKTEETTNSGTTGQLACAKYIVSGSYAVPTLQKTGFYANNELYVTKTIDEDNNISYKFNDKTGKIILSRQMNGSIVNDTYYVYDDYGNLCFVLPPLASDALTAVGTAWTEATATLKNLCYLYRYDGSGRCNWKKIPGADPVFYIFDRADRLIYTQDGDQRSKTTPEWTFSIPDAFGRTVLTGVCKDTISVSNKLVRALYETAGVYKRYSIQVDGVNKQFATTPSILTVNYYDSYDFRGMADIPASSTEYNVEAGYGVQYTGGTKDLLTGTLVAQIATDGTIGSTYLYSVFYYDNRGRLIQTKSNSHLSGGMEKQYTAYNFSGQPILRKHVHIATGKNTQTEVYAYSYDNAGRLFKTTHQLTDGTSTKPQVVLDQKSFDNFGRLKSVVNNGQANLTTSYTYNIRSWIKSITSPLFSQTLYYNESYAGSAKRYNGNISAVNWKHADETVNRGYTYTYDPLSRLTAANYLENTVSSNKYRSAYTYDKQGNMLTQRRYGLISPIGVGTYGIMDSLTMTYTGNQLLKAENAVIASNSADVAGFKNFSSVATEYTYNKNGSQLKDLNKGISGISYNLLNLPRQIDIKSPTAEARHEYTYSADGRKLKVLQKWNPNFVTAPVIGSAINVSSLTVSRSNDYVGNMVYENGVLKRILVEDGYYEGGVYNFYLTDHLGNTRVVAKGTGTVMQKNHYYPFGATFAESTNREEQPYQYNGKELEYMNGLNMYDYGARFYDAEIGRWNVVDPLASERVWVSPYNYAQNNPISRHDPTGALDEWVERQDGSIYWDKNANSQASTKAGERYLGKTLTFEFNSYIDKKLWDGPTMGGLVDPSGDKLTSTLSLTGNENSNGELTSITAKMSTSPGETPMGTARDFYPGEGGSNNVFSLKSTGKGVNLNFEQHASVSPSEEFGLNSMGYKIVDVAQKLNINYTSATGNLTISAYTNIFPSATLKMNGTSIMQYNQPSFKATHTAPTNGYAPTMGSSRVPIKDFSYYPSVFYKR
ncbi:DUF6443 domain-containing protein [Sphingobacterium thalpophilum]|uniref:DUF6443 domain-containing protein n=1 Tax=Sphingobacterium thalpophilum TaxID=259 RepID=UPI002D78A101|nr:RHS repeat-associated core domain-containing protein [Sphingobacterium thalpophilum]